MVRHADCRGRSRVTFLLGNDLDLNVFGGALPTGIDLLFIDTDHTFAQHAAELAIYRHLCRPGALVVLDDIRMNDLPRFWDAVSYPKLDLTDGCHASGFGVFAYGTTEAADAVRAYRESLRVAWDRAAAAGDAHGAPPLWRRLGHPLGLAR